MEPLWGKTLRVVVPAGDQHPEQTVELVISSVFSPPRMHTVTIPGAISLPRSVRVQKDHTVVRRGPNGAAGRKGVVMAGARLPVWNRSRGPGCNGVWYQVHVDGWICTASAATSDAEPGGLAFPVVEDGELTPWQYAFTKEPAVEYRVREGMLEETREVLEGFGFGVLGQVELYDQAYYRTAEGNLIPVEAARITRNISSFSGVSVEGGAPWPVGFVNARRAFAYSRPSRKQKFRIGSVERFEPFEVLEEHGEGAGRFYRFDENAWLYAGDVRVAEPGELPADLTPGEKWIDVDTTGQVAIAFEGDTPVYVTLVSTGREGPSRTVTGEFRMWGKVAAIAMDNTDEPLEIENAEGVVVGERNPFSLHDVPWAQFFFENFALHGVYWHNEFGNRRSHGCVNLAPADARWFFEWTEPALPSGWWAIHSTPGEQGTRVRVR